jgi:hypothetical protein
VKTRGEIAQCDATPIISRENAASTLEDAEEFISTIVEVLAKSHI